MGRNIVIGILYKKAEPFLKEYFDSIADQSTKDFELYLFNNHEDQNYVPNEIEIVRNVGIKVQIIKIPSKPRPISEAREYINQTINSENDISTVIFTDCDDYYSNRRFKLTIEALQHADIVFNDIPAFYHGETDEISKENISPFHSRPLNSINFEDILDYNVIGFLNSGIRAEVLKKAFPLVTDTTSSVNDWFLFAGLLSQGHKATFVPGAVTYYRQHSANTVGSKRIFSAENVRFAITVKKNQYNKLIPLIPDNYNQLVESKLNEIIQLEKELDNPGIMESYVTNVNNATEKTMFFWWEWANLKFLDNIN